MRKFLLRQRNRIWIKALNSSAIICLFLYIIIRTFSFDFPMHWSEEVLLFIKVIFSGTFMMVVATTSCALVYKKILRMKRFKKAA